MVTKSTRIFDASGEYADQLGYIDPPFKADCARFHLFGGNEADSVYNYVNPNDPLTVIGTPTYNDNHVVCTPADGFQTVAGPYFGGTQIVVVNQSYVIATRAAATNIHYFDRGGAHWVRQAGAALLYRADGGLAGTDLSAAFINGVQETWRSYINQPAMIAASSGPVGAGALALNLEEGTEFRTYGASATLSVRANSALRVGGYNPGLGNANGFECYMFLEYPNRILNTAELNVVLKEFVQPLLEERGVRKGAGLLI